MTPSQRIVRLLILLLSQPYRYSRRDLEVHFKVGEDTIQRDIQVLRTSGVTVEFDTGHRYAVLPEGQTNALSRLQVLTEQERLSLAGVLDKAFAKTGHAEVVKRKLESLYDFQRLGLRALRSPELAKIDTLEKAESSKLCVLLVDYRSTNSGEVSQRLVEAFHLDTANGIVHAFDLARKAIRHFRLDRMTRVEVLDDKPWAHAERHVVEKTDPFRIVSRDQVRVHLRLGVAAYNDLLERFPGARAYVEPGAKADSYDFDAFVNAAFRGVSGFVLGNAGDVEVLEPQVLIEELRSRVQNLFHIRKPATADSAGGSG